MLRDTPGIRTERPEKQPAAAALRKINGRWASEVRIQSENEWDKHIQLFWRWFKAVMTLEWMAHIQSTPTIIS